MQHTSVLLPVGEGVDGSNTDFLEKLPFQGEVQFINPYSGPEKLSMRPRGASVEGLTNYDLINKLPLLNSECQKGWVLLEIELVCMTYCPISSKGKRVHT